MLTACGGKAPAEPAETALYGKVTMENAPANALGAVVYLGYYESADAMKAELPETLKDLPLAGYFLLYISFSPRMNMQNHTNSSTPFRILEIVILHQIPFSASVV